MNLLYAKGASPDRHTNIRQRANYHYTRWHYTVGSKQKREITKKLFSETIMANKKLNLGLALLSLLFGIQSMAGQDLLDKMGEGSNDPTKLNRIAFQKDTFILTPPNAAHLSYFLFPDDIKIEEIQWKSSNPDVAEVTDKNSIRANRIGIADITLKVNDKSTTCAVKVISREEYDKRTIRNGILKIDEGVLTIKSKQYINYTRLKEISLPETLVEIGDSAFKNCQNMKDVTIPHGCARIGAEAFSGCVSMKSITIPASVRFIGAHAIPSDTKMIVIKGSPAEAYAQKHRNDYVYRANAEIGVNSIKPMLETNWHQPIAELYRSGKYGDVKKERGLSEAVAFGQVFFHADLNVAGSDCYATYNNVYLNDFDANKADIENIPIRFNLKSKLQQDGMTDYVHYIENVANMLNHPWANDTIDRPPFNYLVSNHVPATINTLSMLYNTKEEIERMLRRSLKNNVPVVAIIEKSKPDTTEYRYNVVIDGLRRNNNATEVHINLGQGGEGDQWTGLWAKTIINKGEADETIYEMGFTTFYEIIPMKGETLQKWTAYRLSAPQVKAIKESPFKRPQIMGDSLCIPEGTISIQGYANRLQGHMSSNNIVFPSTMRYMTYKGAFDGCGAKQITIPENVEIISSETFRNMKRLETVNYNVIGKAQCEANIFKGCKRLTHVRFGMRVTAIPNELFSNVASLKTATIQKEVRYIGENAFYKTQLKEAEIPEGVKILKKGSFYSASMKSIVIPNSVEKFEKDCVGKPMVKCKEDSKAMKWAKRNGLHITVISDEVEAEKGTKEIE